MNKLFLVTALVALAFANCQTEQAPTEGPSAVPAPIEGPKSVDVETLPAPIAEEPVVPQQQESVEPMAPTTVAPIVAVEPVAAEEPVVAEPIVTEEQKPMPQQQEAVTLPAPIKFAEEAQPMMTGESCQGLQGEYSGFVGHVMYLTVTVSESFGVKLEGETFFPFDRKIISAAGEFTFCGPLFSEAVDMISVFDPNLLGQDGTRFNMSFVQEEGGMMSLDVQALWSDEDPNASRRGTLRQDGSKDCQFPQNEQLLAEAMQVIDTTPEEQCSLMATADEIGRYEYYCFGADAERHVMKRISDDPMLTYCPGQNICAKACGCAVPEEGFPKYLQPYIENFNFTIGASVVVQCPNPNTTQLAGSVKCEIHDKYLPLLKFTAPKCGAEGDKVCPVDCKPGFCDNGVCNCKNFASSGKGCAEAAEVAEAAGGFEWWWILIVVLCLTTFAILGMVVYRKKAKDQGETPTTTRAPNTDSLVSEAYKFENDVEVYDPKILVN